MLDYYYLLVQSTFYSLGFTVRAEFKASLGYLCGLGSLGVFGFTLFRDCRVFKAYTGFRV